MSDAIGDTASNAVSNHMNQVQSPSRSLEDRVIPENTVTPEDRVLEDRVTPEDRVPEDRVTLEDTAMRCPLCDRSSRRRFSKYGYWIRECVACQHRFVELIPSAQHVTTVYDDRYFQGGGAGYPDYLAEADLLRQQGRRYAKLLFRYMQPGRMLDVGAAAGFILQGFTDCGWEGYGIEPNPQMAAHAHNQLGLSVRSTSLEQFQTADRYDLITLIQVLPHLFDLRRALQVASHHTQPGGFWLIETWNRQSITARLLGQHWHEYSPPSVLHWFSPKELRQLMAQFDFVPIAQGRPAKWIAGSHAKSLLQYKLADLPFGSLISPWVNRIPDRLKIPYPAEDLTWMLFQKR